MFFVRLGSIIAWLATIFGFARMSLAIWLLTRFEDKEELAFYSRRYLIKENPGEVIDESVYLVVFGVLVGILAFIAKNLKT